MDNQAMFLDCPAYLGGDGAVRCGLPAEVEARYALRSTDGPLESARIRCPRGHWFNGPIESLTIAEQPAVVSGISGRTAAGQNEIAALVPPALRGPRTPGTA